MRHWLAAIGCALLGAASLRADGDSGDFLLTPMRLKDKEIVANDPTATITFGGDSDIITERGGWYCLGKAGYARLYGVGMRKNGEGTLRKDLDPAERVAYVEVVVGAASASNRGKEAALTLQLADDEPAQTLTFATPGEEGAQTTLAFRFDPAVEADYLALRSGPECGVIFEVARVAWAGASPGLAATWTVPGEVEAGADFLCSVNAITGGSGAYARVTWRFQGVTQTLLAAEGDLFAPVTFQAPAQDGDFTVTLEVEDSAGALLTQEIPVRVRPFSPPRNVAAEAVSRTGFRLTWEAPATGLTPEAYDIRVLDALHGESATVTLAPIWARESEGLWETVDPIALDAWAQGLECKACTLGTPAGWEGSLQVRTDSDGDWRSLLGLGDLHASFDLPAGAGRTLRVRAKGEEPPPRLTLSFQRRGEYLDVSLPTEGALRAYDVAGLPPGHTVRVELAARYRLNDGSLLTVSADPLSVALGAVPPLGLKADPSWETLALTWPEGAAEDGLTATLTFRAECPVAQTLPPGLYLTRVYLTGKTDAEPDLSAGKAVVLSNTSDQDIPLNGEADNYALVIEKDGEQTGWDFHLSGEEGEWVYPLVVPAHGELVIAHTKYPPLEMREGVVSYGGNALNFTDAHTVWLQHAGAIVNTLTPVKNAVVRLRADSLDDTLRAPLHAGLDTLPALYDPWATFTETRTLDSRTVTPDSPTYGYGNILAARPPEATRLWVEAVVHEGSGRSEATSATLWEAEPETEGRRGFRLILR